MCDFAAEERRLYNLEQVHFYFSLHKMHNTSKILKPLQDAVKKGSPLNEIPLALLGKILCLAVLRILLK